MRIACFQHALPMNSPECFMQILNSIELCSTRATELTIFHPAPVSSKLVRAKQNLCKQCSQYPSQLANGGGLFLFFIIFTENLENHVVWNYRIETSTATKGSTEPTGSYSPQLSSNKGCNQGSSKTRLETRLYYPFPIQGSLELPNHCMYKVAQEEDIYHQPIDVQVIRVYGELLAVHLPDLTKQSPPTGNDNARAMTWWVELLRATYPRHQVATTEVH